MTLALEHLPPPESPLRRLDPRWKLAALLPAALAAAALRSVPTVLAALAGSLLLASLSRRGWSWYVRRLGPLLMVLTLFAAAMPFLIEGPGWHLELGWITLSEHGFRAAVLLVAKALAVVLLMTALLVTAPWAETLKAAHNLRVPGLLVQLADLTYRYVFVLGGELSRLRVALRVRGFRGRAGRHGYRTVAHVGGTLLVRGYERAERVGQAMRCRGFDGRFRTLTEFHTTIMDVVFFSSVVLAVIGLLVWDWFLP